MKLRTLVYRNLLENRRNSLSVAAGVLIASAVLTGALSVGDSVRDSLKNIALSRLGSVSAALQTRTGLFRQQLADSVAGIAGVPVSALLVTEGIAVNPDKELRHNHITVIGADARFFRFWDENGRPPASGGAYISKNLAGKLMLQPGDDLLLKVRPPGFGPGEAPFMPGRNESFATRVRVDSILPENSPGRFSLLNEQASPFNVILPVRTLARLVRAEGKANILLAGGAESVLPISRLDSAVSGCRIPSDDGIIGPDRVIADSGIYQLTTASVFFDSATAEAVAQAIPQALPLQTYLVNTVRAGSRSTPYSFITAAGSGFLSASLPDSGIIVTDWLAADLGIGTGDRVTLRYYIIPADGNLTEDSAGFTVTAIVPQEGSLADRQLMPRFPGCRRRAAAATGKRPQRSASTGSGRRMKPSGRNTAAVRRPSSREKAGERLWKNRFGTVTAFRFPASPEDLPALSNRLARTLDAKRSGLFFRPVRTEALQAAQGTTDFGELFLSLSFFILAGALLLTGLLFTRHATDRAGQAALLAALGYRRNKILWLFGAETLILAIAGTIPGVVAGIGYTALMLQGLNTIWQGAVNAPMLSLSIRPATLATGLAAGTVVAFLVLFILLIRTLRRPATLAIREGAGNGVTFRTSRVRVFLWFTPQRRRSLLSAAILLALGVFTILLTAANRQDRPEGAESPASGTGGYSLWCETAVPLQSATWNEGIKTTDTSSVFNGVRFVKLSSTEGDDASCLNINQAMNPALTGVPAMEFDREQRFSFTAVLPGLNAGHPWRNLLKPLAPGVFPGIADQTVITWGLRKRLGDTLTYRDGSGNLLRIRLVAALQNSVFQGRILISDSLLKAAFPHLEGFRNLLVAAPSDRAGPAGRELESGFRDQGLTAVSTVSRLESFNTVSNTYLSVFLLLGSLGVILGTMGLAVVVRRNINARQTEVSLKKALGFNRRRLLLNLFASEMIAVAAGMTAGIATALPALAQAFSSTSGRFPWIFTGTVLGIILASSAGWIIVYARSAVRKRIPEGLRSE